MYMKDARIAHASVTIHAPASKVWEALTNPEMIKQYLFGTNAVSDWKEGSSIRYTGTWDGKTYEDKGTIVKVIPEKLLVSTYWSSMEGLEDKPENYKNVSYALETKGDATILTVTQDNNTSEESRAHSEGNWNMVLGGVKKLLEQ